MKNIKAYSDFINEGRSRYDGIANKIVKKNFRKWITDWKA